MAKGKYKKKKTHFKKGHPYIGPMPTEPDVPEPVPEPEAEAIEGQDVEVQRPCPSPPVHQWKVLDRRQFNDVTFEDVNGVIKSVDCEGNPVPFKFLRPRDRSIPDFMETKEFDISEDNRLIHQKRSVEMWNDIFFQHESANCPLASFHLLKEIKKGVCVEQQYTCKTCMFVSDSYKLYEVVDTPHKRGPKFAAANIGIASVLQDMPIGVKKASLLLCGGLGLAPPAKSGFQSNTNYVGEKIVELVQDDLKYERTRSKSINALKGLPLDSPINASGDTRYNTNTIASRGKFGQNSSQAVTVISTNQTRSHEIVGVHVANKLCWRGARMRNQGINVDCPGGHPGCTANYPKEKPFQESAFGIELANLFAQEMFLIRYITTDGDGKLSEGLNKGFRSFLEGQNLTKKDGEKLIEIFDVIRHSDYVHLGVNQFKQAFNAKFSAQMFAGNTVEDRNLQQHLFCLDLKGRSHLVMLELHKVCNGDLDLIIKKLPAVIDATIKCYAGNHSKCRNNSLVCSGGLKKNWFAKSRFLSAKFAQKAYMPNEKDVKLLFDLISIRLGIEAIKNTINLTNTNKPEASNRGFSTSDPKNVNSSRNANSRIHSAVFRMKKGSGTATYKKLTHLGAEPKRSGKVFRALKQFDRVDQYHKTYKKRPEVVKRLTQQKMTSYLKHFSSKTKCEYEQGQMDLRSYRKARRPAEDRSDHVYNQLPENERPSGSGNEN